MKKILFTLLLAGCSALQAEGDGLQVTEAYLRLPPPGQKLAAAYFVVSNHAEVTCHITGAETSVSTSAEIHEHLHRDGMMKMRPVASLEVAPGERIEFQPGGYHLMLFGLAEDLAARGKASLRLLSNCDSAETAVRLRSLLDE